MGSIVKQDPGRARQGQAEKSDNSRNKFHQTTGVPFVETYKVRHLSNITNYKKVARMRVGTFHAQLHVESTQQVSIA